MAATVVILRPADGTTFVVPSGVFFIKIKATGNGGSGGVVSSFSEGGGGGGAFSSVLIFAVSPGDILTINWGAVGALGVDSTDVWISKTGSIPASVADGCLAASGKAGAVTSGAPGAGGQGGQAANCIGDVKNSGGNGANGISTQGRGGGGGGPGTESGAGPNGNNTSAVTGGGAPGTNSAADGGNPTDDGGGGGGGGSLANSKQGRAGKIVLEYTPETLSKKWFALLPARLFSRF